MITEAEQVTILNVVTEYDRKQSGKRGYNIYALGQYIEAKQRAVALSELTDTRTALLNTFNGRLLDAILRKLKLPISTKLEAMGQYRKVELPESDDE